MPQGSRRVYELEVRNQAEALEKQLRRGTYRDSLVVTQTYIEKYYVLTLCTFILMHTQIHTQSSNTPCECIIVGACPHVHCSLCVRF